jgi:hypothetical protein
MILQYIWPVVAIMAALMEAYFDAKGDVTEHFLSATIRTIVAMWMAIFILDNVYHVSIYTAILLNSFWIVFDPVYNLFKGNKVWYIGNTAQLDIFARKHYKEEGGFGLLITKLVLMVILLGAYSL